MTKVSAISTVCKNCVFAIYDGKTQVGCAFNRTEKVDQHDIYELIEAEDEEKEFYILNNHICPYQRTSRWIHADDKDIMSRAKEEVYMRWGAILLVNKDSLNIKDISNRIQELKNQDIPPQSAVIVLKTESQISNTDMDEIFHLMNSNFNLWYIQNEMNNDTSERFSIDTAFDKLKNSARIMFYSVFKSDQQIPKDFYSKIHKYVIDDMNTYGIIKIPGSMHCFTVSKIAHQKYAGNSNGVDLEYKIEHENKDLTWTDITNKKPNKELKDKFIVDYNTL